MKPKYKIVAFLKADITDIFPSPSVYGGVHGGDLRYSVGGGDLVECCGNHFCERMENDGT